MRPITEKRIYGLLDRACDASILAIIVGFIVMIVSLFLGIEL